MGEEDNFITSQHLTISQIFGSKQQVKKVNYPFHLSPMTINSIPHTMTCVDFSELESDYKSPACQSVYFHLQTPTTFTQLFLGRIRDDRLPWRQCSEWRMPLNPSHKAHENGRGHIVFLECYDCDAVQLWEGQQGICSTLRCHSIKFRRLCIYVPSRRRPSTSMKFEIKND